MVGRKERRMMQYIVLFVLFVSTWFFADTASAQQSDTAPGANSQVDDFFEKPLAGLNLIGKLKPVPSCKITRSGVSIGFECLDRYIFDPGLCYDKLAETGAKWARCQTGWCRCEKEKGKYDFQWLDDVVDNLRRRGVQPWFNVGYGNSLYMTNTYGEAAVGFVPLYYGDETLQAWKSFVRALSRHFKGRVTHWEIWNEPEVESFWQPSKPDPLEYLKLVRLTGAIIREEIPDAKIGGSSAHILEPYTVKLVKGGAGKEMDFYCVHAYRVQPEKDFIGSIASLRRLFNENGGLHVKIWQGESGFASHFPPKHWLHPYVLDSESNQAKWLLRRFVTDMRAGIELTSFFQMVDMTAKPYQMAKTTQADPARHGILHGKTYERKMSFHALSHYCAVFDCDTVKTDLYASINFDKIAPRTNRVSRIPDVAVITQGFIRKGWPLYLYYMPEDVQFAYSGLTNITLQVMNDVGKGIKNPVLVDMLKGRVFEIKEVGRDSSGCSNFKKLPLTDYPLVVTDREALQGRID